MGSRKPSVEISPRLNTMAHHNGSVIDHVHLRVADVEKRKRFCSAALSTLRLKLKDQDRSFFFGDEFFVEKADG
jgi:catechol-2,3-dioxygenase